MARNAISYRIFCKSVTGMATCMVCGRFASIKLAAEDFDTICDLHCSACGGTYDVDCESLVSEIVCECVAPEQ